MEGIVDRFEGGKVLVEVNEEIMVYDRSMFPDGLKEGDCVRLVNDGFIIDEDRTKARKRDVNDLFKSLIDKDK